MAGPFKLNWHVNKNADGSFVRRTLPGDSFNLHYIDVEWTHADRFPPDTVDVPITHPPDIKFERVIVGQRRVIQDQLIVTANITDAVIAMQLDEKRPRLAAALNIEV